MKFYGNYKNLIKQEWIDKILNTKGIEISPWTDHDESNKSNEIDLDQTLVQNEEQQELYTGGVYGDSLVMAEIFDQRNIPFYLDLGDLNYFLTGDWWIVKQKPGQFMPLHRDTPNSYNNNYRFWMPWTDYQQGHVFIHEEKFIKNYQCGDLYRYNKDNDLHGSVNIGLTSRIVLQISQKELP